MTQEFFNHSLTTKEQLSIPKERDINLQPYIDIRGSEKIYKIIVKIKKEGITNRADFNNFTY